MNASKSSVDLRVRLSALGPGRMEARVITVKVEQKTPVRRVLRQISEDYEIMSPVFHYVQGQYVGGVEQASERDTIDALVSIAEPDVNFHLELWRSRENAKHDLYPEPMLAYSPIKKREGFKALCFAVMFQKHKRFAEILPNFDARASYGDGIAHWSCLSDILVDLSSGSIGYIPYDPIKESERVCKMVQCLALHPNMDLGALPTVFGKRNAPQQAAKHGQPEILRILLDAGAPATGVFQQLTQWKSDGSRKYVEMLEIIAQHASKGSNVKTEPHGAAEADGGQGGEKKEEDIESNSDGEKNRSEVFQSSKRKKIS